MKAALPALIVAVPRVAVPFLKVTVPLGVPEAAALTVAVNVTSSPDTDGFTEEASVTDDPSLLTVCDNSKDVLVR